MLSSFLESRGLNMQAVFNLRELPEDILARLLQTVGKLEDYRQLLLFANGGPRYWEVLQEHPQSGADPVDEFATSLLDQYMRADSRNCRYRIVYPGVDPLKSAVPLQRLGALVGWHHESPLKIGINAQWGLWFAYRCAVLTDTDFAPTEPEAAPSPCDSCETKPCISSCPAAALKIEEYRYSLCVDYRFSERSPCIDDCLARVSCPVAGEQRYSDEQRHYHYRHSLRHIRPAST